MNSRELFDQTLKDELPRFERVLKAVPEGSLDYRPHEKSRSAGELLGCLVDEAHMLVDIVKTGRFDVATFSPGTCKTAADAASGFGQGMQAVQAALAAKSEAEWESSPAQFVAGEKVEWETPLGKMAWGFLLDLIHHRGQLSVYLRPMGGRVPSIYGPSADENG